MVSSRQGPQVTAELRAGQAEVLLLSHFCGDIENPTAPGCQSSTFHQLWRLHSFASTVLGIYIPELTPGLIISCSLAAGVSAANAVQHSWPASPSGLQQLLEPLASSTAGRAGPCVMGSCQG